jgi:hypothetical protein
VPSRARRDAIDFEWLEEHWVKAKEVPLNLVSWRPFDEPGTTKELDLSDAIQLARRWIRIKAKLCRESAIWPGLAPKTICKCRH